MSELPGVALANLEEQLQSVLSTLQRFQKASTQFEKSRETLDDMATKVEDLLVAANGSLQPALHAVATLRELDPDVLLSSVNTAVGAVREHLTVVEQQLARMEAHQTAEMEKTGRLIHAAVAEIQGVSKKLPEGLHTVETFVRSTRESVLNGRPLLFASLGLGGLNLVLLVTLLVMR